MRIIFLILLILSLVLGGSLVAAAPDGDQLSWQEKVDRELLGGSFSAQKEFIVLLKEQADLSGAANLTTKAEKGEFVYQSLVAAARRSQGPIIQHLLRQGVEHRSFWVANMVWVRGNGELLQSLAGRQDVAHIYANPQVKLAEPEIIPETSILRTEESPEWNISIIHAPEVWTLGYQGQGIVIGGQDTGYEWDHPALINQYRGWDGASADHNYNWHDAIHDSSGNPCGSDAPAPCDDHHLGHGTHTMGTMVGQEADGSNPIGVAPGAKWIGCRNMDQGIGSPATYIECYQWFLAPTDLDDQNPDPSKAPHVINNSWSCPVSEGCTDALVLQQVVKAVRTAGILTVHSAGNSGPACWSINTPAAIYEESFTVGNTDRYDQMAISSSRGPVTIDENVIIKPDVAAPGSSILSSVPFSISEIGYGYLSGTSMAGPHVAGLVALLYSAQPGLIGQVDLVERLIAISAVPTTLNSDCGGIPGTAYPNNASGWGRVDALNAWLYSRHAHFFPWISR